MLSPDKVNRLIHCPMPNLALEVRSSHTSVRRDLDLEHEATGVHIVISKKVKTAQVMSSRDPQGHKAECLPIRLNITSSFAQQDSSRKTSGLTSPTLSLNANKLLELRQ